MTASRETVLVLEGDEVSHRELEGLLEGAGYDVLSPGAREGGLRALPEKGADLALGTAFLVDQDGWLLTNHHVVEPW